MKHIICPKCKSKEMKRNGAIKRNMIFIMTCSCGYTWMEFIRNKIDIVSGFHYEYTGSTSIKESYIMGEC